jgi:Ca2+-transporting ATPase
VENIHYDNLLVGDIVLLANGINIPVDGIMLSDQTIAISEAAMTGESDELPKFSIKKCN